MKASATIGGRLLAPDIVKGTAAQIITWHHFSVFGPMSDAAWPAAPFLFQWLADYGRLSVQCFLVVSGFMAAAALLPGGSKPWSPPLLAHVLNSVFGRYIRLAKVYFIGLAAALVCAAISRGLIQDLSVPAAPDLFGLVAHLFFAQDLLGVPALTAGAWYVAIDLQLYAMLALMCASAGLVTCGSSFAKVVAMVMVATLATCSLMEFNLYSELDIWGIYFFGSYGLGIAAYWVSRCEGWYKVVWTLVMMLLCGVALLVQWRSRIAVSAMTGLLLIVGGTYRSLSCDWLARFAFYLSRISFPLFVLHYPLLMLVGALVASTWEDNALANGLGLVAAWAVSMAAATLASNWLEPVAKPSSVQWCP